MKLTTAILFVAIVAIASVLAAPTTPKPTGSPHSELDKLKRNVEASLNSLTIMIEVIHGQGHGNLLGTVKNLAHTLRQFAKSLNKPSAESKLKKLNEQYERFGQRMDAEIDIVLEALNNHKPVTTARASLVVVGHELIEQAKKEIEKHEHRHGSHQHVHREHIYEEINVEIQQIDQLLIVIGSSDKVSEKDATQMYRHELTMAKLLHELRSSHGAHH